MNYEVRFEDKLRYGPDAKTVATVITPALYFDPAHLLQRKKLCLAKVSYILHSVLLPYLYSLISYWGGTKSYPAFFLSVVWLVVVFVVLGLLLLLLLLLLFPKTSQTLHELRFSEVFGGFQGGFG